VRPRPRGQVCGQEPAREDAGAPLLVSTLSTLALLYFRLLRRRPIGSRHQRRAKLTAPLCGGIRLQSLRKWSYEAQ